MEKKVAEELISVMLECGRKIDDSIAFVEENSSTKDFHIYRKSASKIMGTMLIEIMNPIVSEFPELKPDELQ
jgi:hypothetical protein